MKNKITIIGLNFYPEDTAIGLYSTQMAEYLNENGFQINVITGFPYYPQWEIYKDYSQKPNFFKEQYKGISIYRYKQYVPKKPSFFKRIVHMLDFSFGALVNTFKVKKTDLIISIVPFTSSIFIAKFLSVFRKTIIWVHIQDFEFDAALQTGVSSNKKLNKSWLYKSLFFLERKLLNTALISSTISNTMLEKLKEKTNKETFFFPNWIDEDFISPLLAKPHSFFEQNKFNILYSGNIGEKQDWSLFIDFAKKIEYQKDIDIIVVGSGSRQKFLLEGIKNLKNVSLHSPIPYKDLCNLLCSADVHILFQKNEVLDTVMPSKLLGMMASEKPSIVTGNINSEVSTVLKNSNGGFYFDSNNTKLIVDKILQLKSNKVEARLIGKKARKYVVEKYSKKRVLSLFIEKLKTIIDE